MNIINVAAEAATKKLNEWFPERARQAQAATHARRVSAAADYATKRDRLTKELDPNDAVIEWLPSENA